ncbi:MAG: hypothetical protein J7J46_02985 [Candidatus Desulfofervidus sp.]|nr:hypothetical protein [Candidatus Desulfofervidus sp.]
MSCPIKGRAHPEGRSIMKCPARRAPEKLRIDGLGLLFFKNNPADNILLLLAHERI